MKKVKMVFMKEAPTFVFTMAFALFGLVFITGVRLLVCGDTFGLYLIGLILAGIGTITYAVGVFSRGCGKTFSQLMKDYREHWEDNGNG